MVKGPPPFSTSEKSLPAEIPPPPIFVGLAKRPPPPCSVKLHLSHKKVSAMSNSDVNITSSFQRNFYFIDAYLYDAILRKCGGFSPGVGRGMLFDDGGGRRYAIEQHTYIVIQNYIKDVIYLHYTFCV